MENDVFRDSNIARSYIKLSMPLVFSMVVTLVYNLADTFFVAKTNDANIVAGVSLCAPLFTALMAIGNIFGQGGSSLISRLLGKKDYTATKRVSSFCFYVTLLLGVVIAAVLLLFRAPLLKLMGTNSETFSHASDYFFWLSLGAPFVLLAFIHSNLLRSEGMSKESMTGTILGAVLNIVLDPIFISGLNMGASGAAVASVLGYIASDAYSAIIVFKRSKILSIDPKIIRIPADHLKQIFAIGIPAAIVNLMQSVSSILVNQFLLPYGNEKIAAMGIALKVSMIALLLLTGLTFGSQPLFGFYFGSGDKERLGKLLKFCVVFIGTVAIVLGALVFVAAPLLMRCFMNTASIVSDGTVMLRWQMVSMLCVAAVLLITIIFQSAGYALGSFILSISRQGVLFLAVLAIAYRLFGYHGVLASQAVADVLSCLLALALFIRRMLPEFRGEKCVSAVNADEN